MGPEPIFPKADACDEIIGATLDGGFEIIGELGRGGMCAVYKARQTGLNRVVALKLLLREHSLDKSAVQRFRREALAASKLQHPNIVEVYSLGTWNRQPFIAMEFIDGISLAELIREGGPLNCQSALPLFLQICDALTEAHRQGVLHRDIKPSNVMLVEQRTKVKLVDFGIAKFMDDANENQKLTQTGQFIGSTHYMSPEQCVGSALDARSDLYSFGCLMYEVLSGAPPFADTAALNTLRAHTDQMPACDARLGSLQPVILRALAKAPNDRPSSAQELKQMLLAPHTVSPNLAVPTRAFNRRGIFGALLCLTGFCLLTLAGSFYLSSRTQGEAGKSLTYSQSSSDLKAAANEEAAEAIKVAGANNNRRAIPLLESALRKLQDKDHETSARIRDLQYSLALCLSIDHQYEKSMRIAHEAEPYCFAGGRSIDLSTGLALVQMQADAMAALGHTDAAAKEFARLDVLARKYGDSNYEMWAVLKLAGFECASSTKMDQSIRHADRAMELGPQQTSVVSAAHLCKGMALWTKARLNPLLAAKWRNEALREFQAIMSMPQNDQTKAARMMIAEIQKSPLGTAPKH